MSDSAGDDQPAAGLRELRIQTGARLHFGLLNTVAPFGGLGVMIEDPITEVVVTRGREFRCAPELLPRLLPIARRIQSRGHGADLPACCLAVPRRAPAHVGLGSGTQLSLAIAEGLSRSVGLAVPPGELATGLAGRGDRSAVGIHGYWQGGLILETGGPASGPLNALTRRAELPESWYVAVVRPADAATTISGQLESQQFDRLPAALPRVARELEQLAARIVTAAERGDFAAFTEQLETYNRLSGSLFASVQGGPYRGSGITDLVAVLKRAGGAGVGQSSWGPGVFLWFESRGTASDYLKRLPKDVELIVLTRALNRRRRLYSKRI